MFGFEMLTGKKGLLAALSDGTFCTNEIKNGAFFPFNNIEILETIRSVKKKLNSVLICQHRVIFLRR